MVTIKNKISGEEQTMNYAIFREKIVKDLWDVIKFDDIVIFYSVDDNGKKGRGQIVELEHAKDLHRQMPNSITYTPYSFEDYKHDALLAKDKELGRIRVNYPSNEPVKPKFEGSQDRDEALKDLIGGLGHELSKKIKLPSELKIESKEPKYVPDESLKEQLLNAELEIKKRRLADLYADRIPDITPYYPYGDDGKETFTELMRNEKSFVKESELKVKEKSKAELFLTHWFVEKYLWAYTIGVILILTGIYLTKLLQ